MIRSRFMLSLLVSVITAIGVIPSAVAGADPEQRIREVLSDKVSQLNVTQVRATDLDGIYEVRTSQETLYMTRDGGHAFVGTMLRFDDEQGIVNVTEQGRSAERRKALSRIDSDDMIIFPPESKAKAVLHVFTDVNCGYCRKLHSNMAAMNEMGIQVNYLSFPRGGPGSEGYRKAVSAWCAENSREAITRAKQGKSIPERECDDPVREHYQLGRSLGVSGTPAMVLENGRMVPGFRPPEALAKLLDLNG